MIEQEAFGEIKRMVSTYILLAYQYFNKLFYIHTDAIEYQLNAVIIQECRPIYLYIRNLTGTHTRYTVI